jgi:hypothetical protein
MFTGFRDELIEAATAAVFPVLRGIIVLGSNGSWLVAAPAAEGESILVAPPTAEASAALAAVPPAACVEGDVVPVVEEPAMA